MPPPTPRLVPYCDQETVKPMATASPRDAATPGNVTTLAIHHRDAPSPAAACSCSVSDCVNAGRKIKTMYGTTYTRWEIATPMTVSAKPIRRNHTCRPSPTTKGGSNNGDRIATIAHRGAVSDANDLAAGHARTSPRITLTTPIMAELKIAVGTTPSSRTRVIPRLPTRCGQSAGARHSFAIASMGSSSRGAARASPISSGSRVRTVIAGLAERTSQAREQQAQRSPQPAWSTHLVQRRRQLGRSAPEPE